MRRHTFDRNGKTSRAFLIIGSDNLQQRWAAADRDDDEVIAQYNHIAERA